MFQLLTRDYRLIRVEFVFAAKLMFMGCLCLLYVISSAATTASEQSAVDSKRIALMPFLRGQLISPDGMVDKPLSRPLSLVFFEQQNLRDNADKILFRLVARKLKTRLNERLIASEETGAAFEDISKNESLDTPRKLAVALGKKLQAELVVVGSVWRYRDRNTVKEVPEMPTSVAFGLYLVEVGTGERLWMEKFDGTQKFPSGDVVQGIKQLKMGPRWLSADELARYGVGEVLKKFPIE